MPHTWWRHQMETFFVLLAICAGNSPVSGEFPAQRPVTRSFDVFFDLRLDGRLSKHSWGWWLETPSCPLWRRSNEHMRVSYAVSLMISKSDLNSVFIIAVLYPISCYVRPDIKEPHSMISKILVHMIYMIYLQIYDTFTMIQKDALKPICLSK